MRLRDRVAVALTLALVMVPLVPAQPADAALYCEQRTTTQTVQAPWGFGRTVPVVVVQMSTRCTGNVAISATWPSRVASGDRITARARVTARFSGEPEKVLPSMRVNFVLSGVTLGSGRTDASGWAEWTGIVTGSPGIKPMRAECVSCDMDPSGRFVNTFGGPVMSGTLEVVAVTPEISADSWPSTVRQGQPLTATVRVLAGGAPSPGQYAYFYLGGRYLGGGRTDANGVASLTAATPYLTPGSYDGMVRVYVYSNGVLTNILSMQRAVTVLANRPAAPTQVSVTPASSTTNSFTAGWVSVTAARYQYSIDGGALHGFVSTPSVTGIRAPTTGTHQFNVAAMDGAGAWSDWSAPARFTLLPPPPPSIADSWPSTVRQGQPLTATVRVLAGAAPSPGQYAYFYLAGRYLGGGRTDANGVASLTVATPYLTPGSYEGMVRVYAYSSGVLTNILSVQRAVTVLANRPAAPTNVSVTPTTSATSAFTASWAGVPGAVRYRFDVDGRFAGYATSTTGVPVRAPSLGTHRLTVYAMDAYGTTSDPSAAAPFTWEQQATRIGFAFGSATPSLSAPAPFTMTTARCVGGYVTGTVTVSAVLADASGSRIAGEFLKVFGPGWSMWTPATNAGGRASLAVPYRARIGTEPISVAFPGDAGYRGSQVSSAVIIPNACAQPSPTPTLTPIRTPVPTPRPLPPIPPDVTPTPIPTQPPFSVDVPPS